MNFNKYLFIFPLIFLAFISKAQPIPSKENNFQFLQTFGNKAKPTWGDDDFNQIYFISIPINNKDPFYIRVFDADCGGQNDQENVEFNTQTKFSVYGGAGSYSNADARKTSPIGNFNSGVLLATKKFGIDAKYDNNWYEFGPFNPSEGEYDKDLNANVFKIIAEGINGDDGNMYNYFISAKSNENKPIEGINSFAYELSIRISPNTKKIAHIYPFIDKSVVSIVQNNFDFDNIGTFKLTSVARKNVNQTLSTDGLWEKGKTPITDVEKNTSLDYSISNDGKFPNDIVIYFVNQYGQAIPFFTTPIGGTPKYKYKIDINYEIRK